MQFSTTKARQDEKYIIQLEKHSDSRTHGLDIQRNQLLASVSFMTSQPEHKHSYKEGTLTRKSKLLNTCVIVSLISNTLSHKFLFFSSDIRHQYKI